MTLSLVAIALFTGCGQPLHQQYDLGRAYTESMQIQADLTRPSVEGADYALSGVEGLELRQRVTESSTDTETATTETTQSFTVQ